MPEHLTRQFLQMTFAGNSPLYVCVCVFFAAVCLSMYFIKRETAFHSVRCAGAGGWCWSGMREKYYWLAAGARAM